MSAEPRRARTREALAIAAILLVAAAFRLYRLNALPPGLFQDEAVYGVDAQTVLDGAGQFYYGEREPFYEYVTAGGMLLLGRSPFALRATSALVGLLGVAAAGALARQLFGRRVGLLAAAGVATSLWLVTISRLGFRAGTFPTVEAFALALFWRATRTRRLRDYAIAGPVLGLCLYTYLASRFLPLALGAFLLLAFALHRDWLIPRVRGILTSGALAVVTCFPLGYYAFRHPEMLFGRPDQVALPSGSAFLPAFASAVVNTLGMVFVHGDNNWRQNVAGVPVFDPLNAALFLVGLVVALRWRKPEALFAVVLAGVMLLPSMLSIDSPHYLRTLGAASGIYALWAVGLDRALSRFGSYLAARDRPSSRPPVDGGKPAPSHHAGRVGVGWAYLLPAAVVAVGLVVGAGRSAWEYFVVAPSQPELRAAFATDLVAVGQTIAASPVWRSDRASVYVPAAYDDNHGTIAYFLYPLLSPAERAHWFDEKTIGTFVDFARTVPLPTGPSLYVLPGSDDTTLAILGPSVVSATPILDDGKVVARAVQARPMADLARPESPTRFGRWIELEGASADPSVLTLRWRVAAVPPYLPSIFVHVQDAQRHTIAQADEEIGLPLDSWKVGQELVTRHPLKLPAGTPPGDYHLVVGVYDKSSGQRETPVRNGAPLVEVEASTFTLPAAVPGAPAVPRPVNRPVAPGLTLLGYDAPTDAVEAGASVPLTLVWQATDARRPSYEVGVAVKSAGGQLLAETWAPPGGATFPTSGWASSQDVQQIRDVTIPASASGTVTLSIAARAIGGVPGTPVELARLAVKPATHVYAAPRPAQPLDAGFADLGALVGVDLPTTPVPPGGTAKLVLYWKASASSPVPYTVFVHLLDAQSHVIGQQDAPPLGGTRPTTGWIADEYLTDPHQVTVDRATPPGRYQVEVGLYDPATGARVATGTPDNRVVVGTIQIGAR